MTQRYDSRALLSFAVELLDRGGLEHEKSEIVAEILLEGDLLGHTTHGLFLLGPYLSQLEAGSMARAGDPRTLADFPAAVTWDGMRLPGPWLTVKAIDLAIERARVNGTCTVAIRRSHHIACLQAFLERATKQGFMVLIACCDPRGGNVAPFGGKTPLYTPDPIAAGWPTAGEPVLLDVSMSITSNGNIMRHDREGRRLPGKWLLDAEGNPTDDPKAVSTKPPGSLLPIGGLDHGHKGYALGLMVEAMTCGLSGHGRADPREKWGASVFVQVLDPALFGGREDFIRQTTWLADACRKNPPRAGFDRVVLPGERGFARKREQLEKGVDLHPSIMPTLAEWADKLGVAVPNAR